MAEIEAVSLNENPQVLQRATAMRDGRAMRQLREERDSQLEELRESGQLHPATIVNFNPVKIATEFGSRSYPVPKCDDPHRPSDMTIELEFGGRKYVGSYLTVRDPFLFPWIRGTKRDDGTGDDIGDHMIRYVLPIGIARSMFDDYNSSTQQLAPMGGILIYKGDRHLLKRNPDTIEVPEFKPLPNKQKTYLTKERSLQEVLSQIFTQQRRYFDIVVRQARGFHADENQRKDITDAVHVAWGEYGVKQGWIPEPEDWMKQSTLIDHAKCQHCSAIRKDLSAWKCAQCGGPFDAFRSFMAGLPVDKQWLFSLPEDKIAEVKKEMKRRDALFGDDEPKGKKN